MSTSSNLIIIQGGRTLVWHGPKGCGTIIWDNRFGLFRGKPDLSWIEETDWEDSLFPAKAPLEKPTYGETRVDFDSRILTDLDTYVPANCMPIYWLRASLEKAAEDSDGPIPASSLKEHLMASRLALGRYGSDHTVQMPALSPQELLSWLDTARVENRNPDFALLELPPGWSRVGQPPSSI